MGVVHPVKSKQNLLVFWKLVNLHDCAWENHCRIIMKTILQEKETTHYSITMWFTKLFQCFKLQQHRQRWTRNGRKIEENFSVGPDESQKQEERGDRWSKDEECKSTFRITDGLILFENCWVGGKAPKVQRSSCIPRWYCKRRFRVFRNIHRTRITSISNDSSNISRLPGCDGQAGDAVSACTLVKKRCSQIFENSQKIENDPAKNLVLQSERGDPLRENPLITRV